MTIEEFKTAIASKYAWPGGYPLMVVVEDGETFCIDCCVKESERMIEALKTPSHEDRDWTPAYAEVNWESDLTCAHCNNPIERAYD